MTTKNENANLKSVSYNSRWELLFAESAAEEVNAFKIGKSYPALKRILLIIVKSNAVSCNVDRAYRK